ncbi:MAG: iron ABC transporter permease [Gemmatimonadota bacterium]
MLHSRPSRIALARLHLVSETGFVVTPATGTTRRLALPLLLVGAALAMVVGVLWGPVPYLPGEVFAALSGADTPAGTIVRQLRLPRVLLAFGVGGSLAVAGAALQALVRNPLAEPWLLGVSGGASLGAVLAVVIGLPAGWSVAGCATVGALAAVALVYRIGAVAGRRIDARVLLLAGVVVSFFAGAMTTALLAVVDPFTFRSATLWLFGGFGGASWGALRTFALAAVLPLLGLWWLARALDLLALGEETAATLGIDVDRTRRLVIVATAILTAATVSVAGMIGFVGLVVPHALRWLVGPLHRRLLPAVFVAGGAFTVLADVIARTVLRPAELPVGVITALVGVPLFAVLLRRSAT